VLYKKKNSAVEDYRRAEGAGQVTCNCEYYFLLELKITDVQRRLSVELKITDVQHESHQVVRRGLQLVLWSTYWADLLSFKPRPTTAARR